MPRWLRQGSVENRTVDSNTFELAPTNIVLVLAGHMIFVMTYHKRFTHNSASWELHMRPLFALFSANYKWVLGYWVFLETHQRIPPIHENISLNFCDLISFQRLLQIHGEPRNLQFRQGKFPKFSNCHAQTAIIRSKFKTS